jgi:multiple sugar transport system ATP-binding protein
MTLASKIVVLNAGRVEQVGSPLQLYRKPANRFVAGFLGAPRMNFLPARIVAAENGTVSVDCGGATLKLPRDMTVLPAGDATLGVRPEDFRLCEAGDGCLSGQVTLVERLGGEALVYVASERSQDEPLVIKLSGDVPLARDTTVHLAMAPNACHLFDPSGAAIGAPP